MKRAMLVVMAALALVGCRSAPKQDEVVDDDHTTREAAQARLERLLHGTTVTCDLKGASLEVVLSQISEQTGASVALDPRLCFTHGPAKFECSSFQLFEVLDMLRRDCPDAQIERWRGVLFVTKAGEPLIGPQTPLLSLATNSDSLRKVNVTFVQTPLHEVCRFAKEITASPMWQPKWGVDPSIADRRVTATFHDVPLISMLEVVCRLADCKIVYGAQGSESEVNVFQPREPVSPDEQSKRKS
jgi:hypothetical protein